MIRLGWWAAGREGDVEWWCQRGWGIGWDGGTGLFDVGWLGVAVGVWGMGVGACWVLSMVGGREGVDVGHGEGEECRLGA